ncbi:metal ABC transporter solute-binding protein, Zn/Mn family [Deinococcus navajonensis]|uniref:Metal ABC transporter solute-binding protein, Zn/Mn family n=1 Tax=Deinococcus navajonensis TaxID=309884 RepID=A0ABV8XQ69_9DEIO
MPINSLPPAPLLRRTPLTLLVSGALLGTPALAAPLQVTATTTILADFVRAVGGNRVQVNVIVPAGGDTHTFQPSTGVIRRLAQSRALLANGAGLEPWLPRLRASAPKTKLFTLSQGLKLRATDAHEAAEHGGPDPHAWWDPTLAAGYVRNVEKALTSLDPAGKASYARNTSAYLKQLSAADAWAKAQVAAVPPARRRLITNHDSLHYLARRYGLQVVGAVMPGLSTEREPSARELAELIQTVRKSGTRVIFTENTLNTRLAQTLARETGARIAPPLYTDALGPAGSAGATYLGALRFNIQTIVRALR